MTRDNIKQLAIAAFRYYAHNKDNPMTSTVDDIITTAAVASTLRHLRIDQRDITMDVIKLVCFALPAGNLPRGTITAYVTRAAEELNTSPSRTWHELQRACRLFDSYYNLFTSKSRE